MIHQKSCSRCGTLKNPHCSMAMSAEHRSKFAYKILSATINPKQTEKQTNKPLHRHSSTERGCTKCIRIHRAHKCPNADNREAKKSKGELAIIWLDVANAYTSHKFVEQTLERYHVSEKTRVLLKDYFDYFSIQGLQSRIFKEHGNVQRLG